MGVSTGIELGWRSRVGNGWNKSGVLTSKGYRSWMVELDWDLARKKTQGSPGPGMGVASRIEL